MSTQKTLETLLKEQLDHTVELSLLESKPDFRFAEVMIHFLERVLSCVPKASRNEWLNAIQQEFPDWDERLVVNGITVDEVQRHTQLHYLLDLNQTAIGFLTAKSKG